MESILEGFSWLWKKNQIFFFQKAEETEDDHNRSKEKNSKEKRNQNVASWQKTSLKQHFKGRPRWNLENQINQLRNVFKRFQAVAHCDNVKKIK